MSNVMVMSIYQKMLPATDNEFDTDHGTAVSKSENLMSMANPTRPPFAYREDRKIETNIRTYLPAR